MKWFFIILLLVNVIYLGWEMDRDTGLKRANIASAIEIPAGTKKLVMLSELEKLPEKRSHIKLDNELSMETFNSEPVLAIELNPNTEQMIDSFMTESMLPKLDENLPDNQEQQDINTPENAVDEASVSMTNKTACYTYGPIPNEAESELLSKWFDDRKIIYKKRQTDEQGKQLFWVYLTPLDSREQAIAAMQDLKEKGIKDLRLISEGDLLNAISLGLFSSQAAVNRRLNEIKAKGYQSVVVPYSGGKKIHWFDVSVRQNSSYVNELFTGFPARFNALPVDCNAIAMR